MKVDERYYDEIFPFKGEWDMPSSCGLKIREVDGKTYVIVTELYQDNPGSSVTYAGRYLAEQICQAKGLDIEKITYVECAPDTNSKLSFYDEEFYVADLAKDKLHRYRQLTPDEIRVMLRAEIEAEEQANQEAKFSTSPNTPHQSQFDTPHPNQFEEKAFKEAKFPTSPKATSPNQSEEKDIQ